MGLFVFVGQIPPLRFAPVGMTGRELVGVMFGILVGNDGDRDPQDKPGG